MHPTRAIRVFLDLRHKQLLERGVRSLLNDTRPGGPPYLASLLHAESTERWEDADIIVTTGGTPLTTQEISKTYGRSFILNLDWNLDDSDVQFLRKLREKLGMEPHLSSL